VDQLDSPPILVLGLGNLLLSDDGVGLRLLEELQGSGDWGPKVEFVDGGTRGTALLAYLQGRAALLILDAVALGGGPGAVHVLRDEEVYSLRSRVAATAHEGNALQLLRTARLLGDHPAKVAVVGVEPEVMETNIGLSPAVEAALQQAVETARGILLELQAGIQ
jgi:hydrogenase maturation protease